MLDLSLCDVSTAPREPAMGHPLEWLGHHYATQAEHFLSSMPASAAGRLPRDPPIRVIRWYRDLIAAKICRALVSHSRVAGGVPELLPDALGSAKMALIAIDRSLTAWQSIAEMDGDARIGGLIELLEALTTALEIRFPDARAFVRPGLDEPQSVT